MIWDDIQQASHKKRAMAFLSQSFDSFYQHSISTDARGVIVWISEAYFDFLRLKESPSESISARLSQPAGCLL
ncbi:hypothetical protein [Aliamphritea spongicola]|nr:hypothetical protein [Aliamphritea spongicola]